MSDNEEENELWCDMCEYNTDWGPNLFTSSRDRKRGIVPFGEIMLLNLPITHEPPLNVPELKRERIHYFMHDIFCKGEVYSFADAVQMKAEDFSWQTLICIEHWGKSAKEF